MTDDRSAEVPLALAANAPTRHAWRNLELSAFFPKEARQAVDAIVSFNEQLTTLLNTTKAGLEIAKALAALASADPLELALRTILQEIEDLINGLLGETTAYALFVPIQKQYYGLGDPIPPDEIDATQLTPDYATLVNNNAFPQSIINANTPDVISFINDSASAQGGNRGYYHTVVSSLSDSGDPARPDFPQDFAVTGVSVIFGSVRRTDIYKIVSLIGRVIDLGIRSDLTSRSQPFPTGLKSKIYPEPTEGTIGVQLDWDPVAPVLVKPLFSAEKSVITEIFVIRSTQASLRERFTWGKNFPAQPTDDINAHPETTTTKVIARLRNDGFIARYVDTSADLKIGTPYYYAIALRYKINDVVQPMSDLSNVVRVFYTQLPSSSRQGIPPDWFATPSLYQMFPILRTIISKIQLFVSGMLTRTASNNGIVNMIEQTIQQIEALIAQAAQLLADIKEITDLLAELDTADIAGIYATSFSVKTGGILGWTSELARRLGNRQDTSRPPFDDSELVAGFVLVAGAPNFSELTAFVKTLALFFGGDKPNAARVAANSFIPNRTLPNKDILLVTGPNAGSFATRNTTPNAGVFTETKPVFGKDMTATYIPKTTPTPALSPNSISKTKPVFDTTMQPATKLDNC